MAHEKKKIGMLREPDEGIGFAGKTMYLTFLLNFYKITMCKKKI